MHFQGVDLNLLVALDALLSEKNVTRAAERIHISQPGMSAALHKLRRHFSDQLLERVGRRLELTPRAKELAGPIKELLFQIRVILDTELSFDPLLVKRTFRIAMSSYCTEVLGESLIRYLIQNGPNISCQIDELTTDTLTRVSDGQLDFCITIPERTIIDPDYVAGSLSEKQLFSDRFVLVAAADNPAVKDKLTYNEFCKLSYIEVRFASHILSVVERVLRIQQRRPVTRAWVPAFSEALSIVANTNAITIVPSRLYQLRKRSLALKCAELPFNIEPLEETCVWHPRNEMDPGHRWFREALEEVANKLFVDNALYESS